jgi:hypothetical protein
MPPREKSFASKERPERDTGDRLGEAVGVVVGAGVEIDEGGHGNQRGRGMEGRARHMLLEPAEMYHKKLR